ncbi:MAG: glycosyltransferase family 39 protein [Anaerolineae bacterium]|nr:glycosyltransferase family 39 protein [Anaerolineae bacterium]
MGRQAILFVMLGVLVAGVLAPSMPLPGVMPGRDSGAFLYTADRILEGEIPYRDIWDHKPPAIFYIDALGLLIGGGSLWGVWFLEFLSLYLAGMLGFVLMRKVLGFGPAIFGTIAWMTSLVLVLGGGNFTEEFALPFQFATLYLFWLSEKQGCYSWRGFLIGIMAAVSFLLKPNLLGIQLVVGIYLLWTRVFERRWRNLFVTFAAIALGASSVILVVVGYFALHGALGYFWDSVFRYNFAYASTTLSDRFRAAIEGLIYLPGLSAMAFLVYVLVAFYIWRGRKIGGAQKVLLDVLLVGLFIEFLSSSFSGRLYRHYYIACLPILGVLAGFFRYILDALLGSSFARHPFSRGKRSSFSNFVFSVLSLVFILPFLLEIVCIMIELPNNRETMTYQTAQYVKSCTTAQDYVLVWGAETGVNFVASRRSPTRFVYQYPLYTSGYQNGALISEFLDDIVTNKPVLIIDTSPTNELIPPISSVERSNWRLVDENYGILPEMEEVFEYLEANYEMERRIGEAQWPVYVYAGKQ